MSDILSIAQIRQLSRNSRVTDSHEALRVSRQALLDMLRIVTSSPGIWQIDTLAEAQALVERETNRG